jgi:uncharacterized protein YjiS (DUF1127 family)
MGTRQLNREKAMGGSSSRLVSFDVTRRRTFLATFAAALLRFLQAPRRSKLQPLSDLDDRMLQDIGIRRSRVGELVVRYSRI